MNINRLAPWNWFKKEEDLNGTALPATRTAGERYPTDPVAQMQREVDQLFDDFFRGFGPGPSRRGPSLPRMWKQSGWLKPSVDIASTAKEYTIKVELPGVDEKDVEVDVAGDTLRIRGEKKQESEDKGRDYYAVERSYGSFQRVLALPEDADAEGVSARFKRGVMTIRIPRKESARTNVKQIEVEAS